MYSIYYFHANFVGPVWTKIRKRAILWDFVSYTRVQWSVIKTRKKVYNYDISRIFLLGSRAFKEPRTKLEARKLLEHNNILFYLVYTVILVSGKIKIIIKYNWKTRFTM